MDLSANILAISRHRIGIDGDGVTTLVVFMGCPLRCRWCLNPQTLVPAYPHATYTPQNLYDAVKQDELYFLASGGGITFGGGEPLLQAGFIRAFREICGPLWKINLETSLHVPGALLEEALPAVDHLFVDIKDMNPEIYRRYTGADLGPVTDNLQYLVRQGKAGNCTVRLPLIPEFNSQEDVQKSEKILTDMGFHHFDKLTYDTERHEKRKRNLQSAQRNPQADCPGK